MARKTYRNVSPNQRFGKLVTIRPSLNKKYHWVCKCDCGNEIEVSKYKLLSTETRSCGCFQKQRTAEANKKENKIVVEGDIAIIYPTNYDKVKRVITIDKEDINKIKNYTWYLHYDKASNSYRPRSCCQSSNEKIYLYWLLTEYNPVKTKCVVDHKNHNPLDNRKINLRIVTRQNNNRNTIAKNFSWSKVMNKYEVTLTIDYKCLHLGFFDSMLQAHIYACDMRKKFFGEYAWDYNLDYIQSFENLMQSNKLKNSKEVIECHEKLIEKLL